VYNNTIATVKRQIQQAENPTPDMVISMEAARVDDAILCDYSASTVALEEPDLAITYPNTPIDNKCMDDELHFAMRGGNGDYEDECN